MTDGKAFVDTNVLLRALHDPFPDHTASLRSIERLWNNNVEVWVSRQIVREYLVRASHANTFAEPLDMAFVLDRFRVVETFFRVADETHAVTEQLKFLLETYDVSGKQIHDTNIVATMLVYDIPTLVTFNVKDFRRFEDKITITTPQ